MSDIESRKIRLGIIDLKLHNLFSIYQACKNIGYRTTVIEDNLKHYNHDIIILPGVGSFKFAMKNLNKNGTINKLLEFSLLKNKILIGICLGMQLLFESSEEFGKTKGLGLIQGNVKKFKKDKNIKIPHIGWNIINKGLCKNNFLKQNYFSHQYYFIHSYYCDPKIKSQICSYTPYGKINFCSSIRKENIFGTQFHPEKSSLKGLEILKNIRKLT